MSVCAYIISVDSAISFIVKDGKCLSVRNNDVVGFGVDIMSVEAKIQIAGKGVSLFKCNIIIEVIVTGGR